MVRMFTLPHRNEKTDLQMYTFWNKTQEGILETNLSKKIVISIELLFIMQYNELYLFEYR